MTNSFIDTEWIEPGKRKPGKNPVTEGRRTGAHNPDNSHRQNSVKKNRVVTNKGRADGNRLSITI